MQPCGYDALIYMLRTLGPVSFLHLSVFSTCTLVRSSSFVSGFVRSPIRVLLPDLSAERKRSWNGGGEWLKGINGIHGCGSNLNSAPVLPPLYRPHPIVPLPPHAASFFQLDVPPSLFQNWCAQGSGAFRDTYRAGFIWEVYPDLSPPPG